jgi:hypothetical protein
MADNNTLPPAVISSDDFEQYTNNWVQLITQGDAALTALNESFAAKDGSRAQYLSMPADWVRWLISTVGCIQVKVRFLLTKDRQFNLTFYATDAQNSRVSAYYLLSLESTELGNLMAAMYGQNASSSDDPKVASGNTGTGSVQIPHGVAGDWVKNWQEADKLTPDMFATTYGFLRGYNFQRDDLMDNLFNIDSAERQQLRVDFGLHKYYAAYDNNNPQPTYTFGLVLRLVNPDAKTSDTPFYDMSTPVPPGY